LNPARSPRCRNLLILLASLCLATELRCQSGDASAYTFTTLAGHAGIGGDVDGTGSSARFTRPQGVAVDAVGNLYVLDTGSETIRKVSPDGVVTPFSGVPFALQPPRSPEMGTPPVDGDATTAEFDGLQGICIDKNGNLYVTDSVFVREVSPTGVVTTLAGGAQPSAGGTGDGLGSGASFNSPKGIAVDSSGILYVADASLDIIRKVDTTGRVSTIAGFPQQYGEIDGTGTAAHFDNPVAMAVDANGNIFVGDASGYTIRKITPGGVVTTVAGLANTIGAADGSGSAAQFFPMNAIAIDSGGNLYVTETNNTIRKITSSGLVTTIAGTSNVGGSADGTGAAALFNDPFGVAVDAAGDLFVADSDNATIRKRYAASDSQPSISTQPVAQSVAIGSLATFSVAASGVPVPGYQWLFNGSFISGATNPTLTLSNVQADNLGTYSVIVTSSSGSVTSNSVDLASPGVAPAAPPPQTASNFANISTRAQVGPGAQIEIVGFVISGPPGSTEQVLVRGDGPSIGAFGVSGTLKNPVLTLFDSNGNQIDTNTDWSSSPNAAQIASAAASVGAFVLLPGQAGGSADSALLVNLTPGAYTAQVTGLNSTSGIALAEVYQVGAGAANLVNISTRAFVDSGASVEIAGLVIHGTQPATVLIRAVGPTLSTLSVSGVLAQPTLTVQDASANTVATNTGWSTNSNAAAIATATATVGAFALPSGSADCALLLTLQPGNYTATVSGVGGTSGIALVEAYQAH
jgi:sugar lactone lactonase YvrE